MDCIVHGSQKSWDDWITFTFTWSSLAAQMVKNLPATWKKAMATHSNILAWRVPWTEEPGGLQFMQLQRVRHDRPTNAHIIVGVVQSPSSVWPSVTPWTASGQASMSVTISQGLPQLKSIVSYDLEDSVMLKGLLKSDWLLYLNKMVEVYSRLVNITKKTQTARDSKLEITSGEKKGGGAR